MAAIRLEELLKQVGVCREKINDGISDEHLLEISTFLTSWRTVAPFLKIESNDLEAIEQEKDEQVKRLKVLQKWKGKFGFTATYRKLVEVLLSLSKADVAEKVCDLLKATEDVPVHVSVNSDSIKSHSVSREPESSDGSTLKVPQMSQQETTSQVGEIQMSLPSPSFANRLDEEPTISSLRRTLTSPPLPSSNISGHPSVSIQPKRVTLPPSHRSPQASSNEEPRPKPQPVRFTKVRTWNPDEEVDLAIGESGIESVEPITVGQLFKNTVQRRGEHPALKYKQNGMWEAISYSEYHSYCIKAAKSFMKLGLEPNHGVCIIGFNSPEWFISNLGAMFAGGLPTGIYTTSTAEECQFVANDCKANFIVVEDQRQLDKILEIRENLPDLKAIVQYKGKLSKKYPNVYEWDEFLKLGDVPEITADMVNKKIMSRKPGQCAQLIYTSGTTGKPKGVMLSHDNLTFTAKALEERHRMEDGREVGVSYLPLSHIAAQMADIYLPLLVGATVYFAQPDALNGTLGQTLREVKPTFFFGVPRVYEEIMERVQEREDSARGLRKVAFNWAKKKAFKGSLKMMEGHSKPRGYGLANRMVLKSVREALGFERCRICVVGADKVHRDVHDYFMSINIQLMELYGLSESSGCLTLNIMEQNGWKVGSCGKSIEGFQLKIVDPKKNRELEGKEGEICICGRHVFMGYLNNEEETKKAIHDDGWLHSGDIGRIEDGFLHFIGRIKDMITTSGGEKIHPVTIEESIKSEIPFLSNVMVVGDKRKNLTCLMTLKCKMDPYTGEPQDTLTPKAQQLIQDLGSRNTKVFDIVAEPDKAVVEAIRKGLRKVNAKVTSQARRVEEWRLLEKDFSIPGGELGPTLKVRRHFVHEKYKATIDDMYNES